MSEPVLWSEIERLAGRHGGMAVAEAVSLVLLRSKLRPVQLLGGEILGCYRRACERVDCLRTDGRPGTVGNISIPRMRDAQQDRQQRAVKRLARALKGKAE